MTTQEILGEIKKIQIKIISEYSKTMYSRNSGDTYFEHIPESLDKLWKSDVNHTFAACDMDQYISKCIRGEMDAHELYNMMQNLLKKFEYEFSLLKQ